MECVADRNRSPGSKVSNYLPPYSIKVKWRSRIRLSQLVKEEPSTAFLWHTTLTSLSNVKASFGTATKPGQQLRRLTYLMFLIESRFLRADALASTDCRPIASSCIIHCSTALM